jgi:hypothetical protein
VTIPGRKFEDALLRAYRQHRAGWWFLELPVGYRRAGGGSPPRRRIDAVILPDASDAVSTDLADLQPFGGALHGADVEIVEAKRELNPAVIGQLLCGLSMFSAEYPSHGRVTLTALVNQAPDAAVRWYCQVERIQIVELARSCPEESGTADGAERRSMT